MGHRPQGPLVIAAEGCIEALASGLVHPHDAAGHGVDKLHAATKAVGMVSQLGTDGGDAGRAHVSEVVVGTRVINGTGGAEPALVPTATNRGPEVEALFMR